MAVVRPSRALRTLSSLVAVPARAVARPASVAVPCRSLSTSTARCDLAESSPRPRASTPSSSSSTLDRASYRSPSSSQHLYAPPPTTQLAYLERLLAPIGPLPNPTLLDVEWAERCLTHKSGVDKTPSALRRRSPEEGGRNGNNEKMSFVGRRLLRLYLTLHLTSRLSTSHPALLAHAMSPRALDAVLDTKQLGATVGHAWKLQDGMRWREVRGVDGQMTGLWKVRGMGVEAVVGGVFTSQGIEVASRLFNELVLPNLVFPKTVRTALSSTSVGSDPSTTVTDSIAQDTRRDDAVAA